MIVMYREPAEKVPEETMTIEEGFRSVVTILKPFEPMEMARILLAVAALYNLPVTKVKAKDDDGDGYPS